MSPVGPEPNVKPILEAVDESKNDVKKNDAPTDDPEISLCLLRDTNVSNVHLKIGSEKGGGEEDYRHNCENGDDLVVRFGDYGKFVLFDGTGLK